MAKTNYVTDSFSTLGGLAAVAYNDVDYFREVKNQIHSLSPTKSLDLNMPSSVFSGLFGQGNQVRSYINQALQSLANEPGDFKDWVDTNKAKLGGDNWSDLLAGSIESELWNNLDTNSNYNRTLEQYIASSLDTNGLSIPEKFFNEVTAEIAKLLRNNAPVGEDVDSIVSIVNNNPFTKVDEVPPDTVLPLNNSVNLGYDYQGSSFELGYLNAAQLFTDFIYPKLKSDSSTLPNTLTDSVKQGYIGYSPWSMDLLYNPGLSEGIGDVAGANSYALPEALSSILSKSNDSVYDISLINLESGGYIGFDPARMSNGDFLDISSLPKWEEVNLDSSQGSMPSSRTTGTAFK